MPQQLELIARGGLELAPEPGRTEPRLWVKRIVIWNSPPEKTREIPLRPGLNIVWSPDPAENAQAEGSDPNTLGHGSGKTLLCRLIRYCLGEPRFAPDGQRHQLASKCPDALVGADIIIDGVHWAVVRPLGTRRLHFAIQGGNLQEIAEGQHEATGIEPVQEALSGLVFPSDALPLMPNSSATDAWLVALAWLTRDQECRFDKELDWRSTESDSASPARGLSVTNTLDAVRVLLKALTSEEMQARQDEARLEALKKTNEQQSSRRNEEIARLRAKLTTELGLAEADLPTGGVIVEELHKTAFERLGRVALLPAADKVHYEAIAAEAARSKDKAAEISKHVAVLDGKIAVEEESLRRDEARFPGIANAVIHAEVWPCPICEVPIDRALAEGCKLSREVPDLEALKLQREQVRDEIAEAARVLKAHREEREQLRRELLAASRESDIHQSSFKEAEKARYGKIETWYGARRLLDEIDRLRGLVDEHESVQSDSSGIETELAQARERAGDLRDTQATVFTRLTAKFDAIIRALLGEKASGKIWLDGVGLKTSVTLGGERSTAAINSLKVIAFDLATLCLSIEGGNLAPAFLLHDSPREADLGLSVYHRLVNFVEELERLTTPPLFQYILTTTTRPPKSLCAEPWLVCELEGNPAEERLMRLDL